MSSYETWHARRWRLPLGAAAMLAMTAAFAQMAPGTTNLDTSGLDTSGNYQSEVQSCKEGHTGESQATCLREARNAQAARKRGQLTNPSTNFQANALARCDVLRGDDRTACQARMMGHGEVTGSVAGGGVLRQVEVVVPQSSQSGAGPAQPQGSGTAVVPAQSQRSAPAQ